MKNKFYGKRIVLGCFILACFPVALVNITASFYMAPVCEAYGFSTGAFSLVYSFAALGAAIGSVVVGSLISKANIKLVMIGGALLSGLAFFGVSLATKLWQFYLIFPLVDLGLAAISSVPLSYLVANWYTDKRGTMTAIVFVGVNLGGVLMSPLMEHIIKLYSWQSAAMLSAIAIIVISIPICLFLLHKDPASVGQLPYVESDETKKSTEKKQTVAKTDTSFEGISRSVAIKSPTFYLLALAMICLGIVSSGIMVHIPNYLTLLGMNYGVIVAVLSFAAIFGTLLNGMLFDKTGPIGGMLVTTILLVLGAICLFLVGKVPALAYVMAVAVGFSICVANTGPPLMTSA
ncbi:MAG: MFS transporter, partial [Clostridiales bacterium]